MVMTMYGQSLMRDLPYALALAMLVWMTPLGAIQTAHAGAPDGEKSAILALMRGIWDKPDAKLEIDRSSWKRITR